MSKKKKLPKSIREQRRRQEAEKAGEKVSYAYMPSPVEHKTLINTVPNVNKDKDLKYTLPIKDIKHDLIKNAMYVVFTVTVLVLLKMGNVDLNSVIKVLSLHR